MSWSCIHTAASGVVYCMQGIGKIPVTAYSLKQELLKNIHSKRYFVRQPALISAVQVLTEGDGRVRVETTKGHCVFTIECAERQDEGVYSVVVRNLAGEDTADINVKVVGERKFS